MQKVGHTSFGSVITYLLLFGIGYFGHILFFNIQENVYTGPNSLKSINDFLGGQTIATSFFVVLWILSASCLSLVFLEILLHISFKHARIIGSTGGILIYTMYEVYQKFHPTYIDWNEGDIMMAVAAYMIVLLCVLYGEKPAVELR